jgi:hypothetical protein
VIRPTLLVAVCLLVAAPTPAPATPAPAAPAVLQDPVENTTVTLRDRALRRNGRIHVGHITCKETCDVTLEVSGGKKKPTVTRFKARVKRALTAPARRGRLRIEVYSDGQLVKTGRVVAR